MSLERSVRWDALRSLWTGRRYPNTPKTTPVQYIKNYGAFRFGQAYNHEDLPVVIRNNDIANLLVEKLPKKAFSEGYELMNVAESGKETKVEWSDEFEKTFNVTRAAALEYGYGAVHIAIFDDPENEGRTEKQSIFKYFEPSFVTFKVSERGVLTDITLRERIAQDQQDIDWIVSNDDPKAHAGLDATFSVILRPGEYATRGISILEPIWDVLHTRACILQSMMMHTARVAAGIKEVRIYDRGTEKKNKDVKSEYQLGLRGMEAGDTSLTIQKEYDEATGSERTDDFTLHQGEGQFNFAERIDVCHKVLAGNTSVPKNYYDGMFQGETLGAKKAIEMLFAAYREIQNDWHDKILQAAELWADWNDKTDFLPTIKVKYRPLVILSEEDQTTMDVMKANIVSMLKGANIMDVQEAREYLESFGLDPTKVIEEPIPAMPFGAGPPGQQPEKFPDKEKAKEEVLA